MESITAPVSWEDIKKIVIIRDHRVYNDNLEFAVFFGDSGRFKWLSEEEMILAINKNENKELFNSYKEWFDKNRFGGATLEFGYPLPPAVKTDENYYKDNYMYLSETTSFYSATLSGLLAQYLNENLFSFTTGFQDFIGDKVIDRKLIEIRFWSEVYTEWIKWSVDTHNICPHIVGHITWTIGDSECLRKAAINSGYAEYYPKNKESIIEEWKLNKNKTSVFLFSEWTNKIPNAYSVILIKWGENNKKKKYEYLADIFLAATYACAHGLTQRRVRQFVKGFTHSEPTFHYSQVPVRCDSQLSCLQFLASVMDGKDPMSAALYRSVPNRFRD